MVRDARKLVEKVINLVQHTVKLFGSQFKVILSLKLCPMMFTRLKIIEKLVTLKSFVAEFAIKLG